MKKKKHVTVPRIHYPGKGRPAETLAYLSPLEHEMIRQMTDGTYERGPKGIRSYADDSMASQGRSPSKSSGPGGPNGPNSGPSSGLGQGGQGSGGNAGGSKASGSPNSGTSTGGTAASKSGSSQSQSSSSTTTGSGGQRGAGSNYGPGSARPGEASTALGKASQAAQTNAARASGTSTQWGGPRTSTSASNTQWGGSAIPQPSRAYPSQFNNDMLKFNAGRIAQNNITDPRAKMDSLHNLTQFSDVSYDPDAVQKIRDRLGYTPIGIRSNNPGNILDSKWQKSMPGYTGPMTSPNGLTYASYSDPRYGLAAQNELLGRYSDMGRNTIDSVVDRYAPVDENNSAAANRSYKEHLANSTGWGRDEALTREQVQSLGPFKTSFENGGTLFAGGPFGGTPAVSGGTQVAGIATAGLSQAAEQARARAAEAAAAAVARGFGSGAVQGPQRYSGPLDSIPAPQSIGVMASPSAFAQDPRLSIPQGAFPAARAQSQVATDPRVSQTPPGAFPAAPKPASVFAEDPRIGVPQGAYPARAQSMVAGDPRVSQTPLGVYPQAHQFANNERAVAPGHWGREEKNYLTQIGAMDRINRDPGARLGYEKMQNPDGSGLRIGPETNPFAAGSFSPETNTANLKTGLSPDRYSAILSHELGHAGAFAKNPDVFKTNLGLEEERQWRVDASLEKPNSAAQADALQKAEMYRIDRKHNAPLAHNTVFSDPRIASPLGSYPAAPAKEVQLAWNVPPLGGAMSAPPEAWSAFGTFGANRPLPKGPAATPGTIHSQTAEATPSASWMDGLKKSAESMGLDPDKIVTVSTDAVKKISEGNKKVAEAQQSPLGRLGLALMGAFGGSAPRSGGLLGNPQDRSDRYFAPPQIQQAMAQQQMAQAPVQDQITQLLQMQQQMIAEGADPEELAALQALIDQLSTQEA